MKWRKTTPLPRLAPTPVFPAPASSDASRGGGRQEDVGAGAGEGAMPNKKCSEQSGSGLAVWRLLNVPAEEKFDCMEWALGKDWSFHRIRDMPYDWSCQHPDLPAITNYTRQGNVVTPMETFDIIAKEWKKHKQFIGSTT